MKKFNFFKVLTKNFTNNAAKAGNPLPSATTPQPPSSSPQQVGQVTQSAEKPPLTKEQQKIETLMSQFPDSVLNPNNIDFEVAKNRLEKLFKYHQGDKPYIKEFDVPKEIRDSIESSIHFVFTTDAIADCFREHEGFIADKFLGAKFFEICTTHQDLTKDFYETILPTIKRHMVKADRSSSMFLFHCVAGAANVGLGDKEFWEIAEFKLVNERLYRYLSLDESAKLVYLLSKSNTGSLPLYKLLELTFIKHRKALAMQPKLHAMVSNAYYLNGKASQMLLDALEDPTIEIPEMYNRPSMDKIAEEKQRLIEHNQALLADKHGNHHNKH